MTVSVAMMKSHAHSLLCPPLSRSHTHTYTHIVIKRACISRARQRTATHCNALQHTTTTQSLHVDNGCKWAGSPTRLHQRCQGFCFLQPALCSQARCSLSESRRVSLALTLSCLLFDYSLTHTHTHTHTQLHTFPPHTNPTVPGVALGSRSWHVSQGSSSTKGGERYDGKGQGEPPKNVSLKTIDVCSLWRLKMPILNDWCVPSFEAPWMFFSDYSSVTCSNVHIFAIGFCAVVVRKSEDIDHRQLTRTITLIFTLQLTLALALAHTLTRTRTHVQIPSRCRCLSLSLHLSLSLVLCLSLSLSLSLTHTHTRLAG